VLSSVAEELTLLAVLEEAKVSHDLAEEAEGLLSSSSTSADFSVEALLEVLAEDTDVTTFLFEERYDGIDQTEAGQMMGMASLRFEDWFIPFSQEPARLTHPYVAQG
jgi:hypothetical protein